MKRFGLEARQRSEADATHRGISYAKHENTSKPSAIYNLRGDETAVIARERFILAQPTAQDMEISVALKGLDVAAGNAAANAFQRGVEMVRIVELCACAVREAVLHTPSLPVAHQVRALELLGLLPLLFERTSKARADELRTHVTMLPCTNADRLEGVRAAYVVLAFGYDARNSMGDLTNMAHIYVRSLARVLLDLDIAAGRGGRTTLKALTKAFQVEPVMHRNAC